MTIRRKVITLKTTGRATGPIALAISERIGVSVDRRRAAEMSVEQLRSLWKIAFLDEVDHALHGFPLIDGVGDHAFETRAEPDRLLGIVGGNAVGRIGVVLDQDDVVLDNLLAQFDQ